MDYQILNDNGKVKTMSVDKTKYGKAVIRAEKFVGKTTEQLAKGQAPYSGEASGSFTSSAAQVSQAAARAIQRIMFFVEDQEKTLKPAITQLLRLINQADNLTSDFDHSKIEFSPEGQIKLGMNSEDVKELIKVADAEAEEEVPAEPQELAEESQPVVIEKRQKGQERTDTSLTYLTDSKYESRKFAGHQNQRKSPVKCALLLPSLYQFDVIQFYNDGLFDDDTQLIYVQDDEWSKTKAHNHVVTQWKKKGEEKQLPNHRNVYGGMFNFRRKGVELMKAEGLDVEMPKFNKQPILFDCKLTDIKAEDPRWPDEKLDYVWLDLCGHVAQNNLAWIMRVLTRKMASRSQFNITAKNEWRENLGKEYQKMLLMKQFLMEHQDLLSQANQDGLMPECIVDEGSTAGNFRHVTDNTFLKAALVTGLSNWALESMGAEIGQCATNRPSYGQGGEKFGGQDIHRYKKCSVGQEMAIHKFEIIPWPYSNEQLHLIELMHRLTHHEVPEPLQGNLTTMHNNKIRKITSRLIENRSQ